MSDDRGRELILLAGATGYVGGRLLSALEREGRRVRCLARRPEFLLPRVGPSTEVAGGDVLREETLGPALEGVGVAYYLVHSMGSTGDFVADDREGAARFANAARAAGVRRIIYLGGLGHEDYLSDHLASRHEVGKVLRASGGPGLRRGRRHPEQLVPGDTVDFWRVERFEPDRLLRLSAEMKLPGRAWLQFEVEPCAGGSRIRQTAIFDPVGLPALIYWYTLYPIHQLVFAGMLRNIARAARADRDRVTPAPGAPPASGR